ncbi:MAG TPA: COX15/CtaA family protein [Candidatus Binatia bacterium]|nr:COX15/CtaA family protein [Candidatus Binatia bacterium]
MTLFRWLTAAALALCFCVVVLGAYVRLSDAGLGCPDWPGCYGHLAVPTAAARVEAAQQRFPGRPVVAHKAWKEMIHRYLASTLGLLILGLFALSFRRGLPSRLPKILLGLVVLQGLLGMWTVTLLLKPVIVTAHLLGGMSTLAVLGWLWLEVREARSGKQEPEAPSLATRLDPHASDLRNEREALHALRATLAPGAPPATGLRLAAGFTAMLVLGQIFLGGWTSSNYAALACPDLPTCQGRLVPELGLHEAFLETHGDVNYEGGVLNNRARVTIHWMHRAGAAAVTLAALLLVLGLARGDASRRRFARLIGAALAVQLALGLGLILLQWPLPLAAAHNAGAALLWLAMISLNHFAWRRASS